MPVIVIGADTAAGVPIVEALLPRQGEVRAFVTDASLAARLRERGVKVAVGDVSDGSHVAGAALNAFCAVVVAEAAVDERERSFAATPDAVVAAWADGLTDAGVTRVIWVSGSPLEAGRLRTSFREFVSVSTVDTDLEDIAQRVAGLDDAATV